MIEYALKEWSVTCDLMLHGECAILLRKGGIIEDAGPGMFRPKYPRFLLFPSWAHQKPEMIIAPFCDNVVVMDEPEEVPIKGMAELVEIWEVPSRESFEHIKIPHIWTETQIDMRFNYKPQNPLFLMLLRVRSLNESYLIPNRLEYGGCKSWVDLLAEDQPTHIPATQVIPEAQLNAWAKEISNHMGPALNIHSGEQA